MSILPPSRHAARLNFAAINAAAMRALPELLPRWLPGGQFRGREYDVLNPKRADRHVGNFRINLSSGKWADFAGDARGGDVISLAAFLFGLKQGDAARKLADMLGVNSGIGRHG
jgi:hypothetical protein